MCPVIPAKLSCYRQASQVHSLILFLMSCNISSPMPHRDKGVIIPNYEIIEVSVRKMTVDHTASCPTLCGLLLLLSIIESSLQVLAVPNL